MGKEKDRKRGENMVKMKEGETKVKVYDTEKPEGWKEPKAVIPSKDEIMDIIRGKERDLVHRQKHFRAVFLRRKLQEAELNEMIKQYRMKKSTIQWQGIPCPKEILKAQINIMVHNYKDIVSEENHAKEGLVREGFSKSDLVKVLNGEYLNPKDLGGKQKKGKKGGKKKK